MSLQGKFFKQCACKTYIAYLNEVRIDYACRQLSETNKPVVEICYESGYNSIVHLHRQFLKSKQTTPLQYRKINCKNIFYSKNNHVLRINLSMPNVNNTKNISFAI